MSVKAFLSSCFLGYNGPKKKPNPEFASPGGSADSVDDPPSGTGGPALPIHGPGFHCLYPLTEEGPCNIVLDIVAVHGLGGDARRTWTDPKTGYFWLQDLPNKFKPSNIDARVFTFGYNAPKIAGKSTATVSDIASSLLGALRRARRKPAEVDRPIIFVCHSLGGIIVKKALNMAGLDESFKSLRRSVYAVAFMGTPHQGTAVANIASIVSSVIGIATAGLSTPKKLTKSLKKESEMLLDLSDGFRHQKINILSFYETEAMTGMSSPVVSKTSAVLNTSEERQIPCSADHRDICRFPSGDDLRLNDVVIELQTLAEGAVNQDHILHLRDQEQKLLKNLSKKHDLDPTRQLGEQLEKKCKGTATWIHEHQAFRKWMDSPTHETLWLNGGPGSGKTTMTASIIESLQKDFRSHPTSSKPLILYCFIDGKQMEKSNHLNIFPGLIHQILLQRPTLAANVRKIAIVDEHYSSTLEKCIKIIHSIVKDIPKIFLVVDAIDESDVLDTKLPTAQRDKQKENLLKQLFELREHTLCLKFLVTSRTYPGSVLKPVFDKYRPPSISLTVDRVEQDIERYMTQELVRFDSIKSDHDRHGARERGIKERVKSTIVRDAGGMFLYAYLAWTTFKDWDDDWDDAGVENRFKKLAILAAETKGTDTTGEILVAGATTREKFTLYAFYLNILNLLPGTDRQQLNSKDLFRWLVTAHTPLTIAELRAVYYLESGSRNASTSGVQERFVMTEEAFAKLVRRCCGALVQIMPASQTVHLYHQSIKEFFLETEHSLSFKRADAEIHSSITCLKYINSIALPTPINTLAVTGGKDETYEADFRLINDYPFLKYAVLHWPHHTQQAPESSELWSLFVSWANSDKFRICCRIFWHYKGKDKFPDNAKPMHVLCFLGLEWLINKAFSGEGTLQWDLVGATDSLGRTPLHWAALNGHDGVVQLLLEKGADPQAKDRRTWTPLDMAMDCGKETVVSLLMGDTRPEGESGKWLEMAAMGGHTAVVRFLLDRTDDVNASSPLNEYGSALHAAAYQGHKEVVTLLLERGADLDRFSKKHGTPLQAAVYEGHLEIVKLLLEKGANPNANAGIHGTALQSAAHRGFTKIITLLIDHNADINISGEYLGTARYAAGIAGHDDAEKVLADAGGTYEPPNIQRQQSDMNAGGQHALDLVEHEVSKGRLPGVKKRVEKIKADMITAILTKNKKKLGWCLNIGVHAFKMAISLENEDFLEFLVNVGMTIAQEAVARKYTEGLRIIVVAWTKALLAAIDEHKASLVQRTLKLCVKDLKTLIANGKDENAADLVIVGIEIYLQMCRVKNQQLVRMVAKIWVEAVEDLVDGAFGESLLDIVRKYAQDWVGAVRDQDATEVRAIGEAGIEALFAAAERGRGEVIREFTPIYVIQLQEVFYTGHSSTGRWLLDEVQPATHVAFGDQDRERAEAFFIVGMEFFLVFDEGQIVESNHPGNMILDIAVAALKAIHLAGLMKDIEKAARILADEKFRLFEDNTPGRKNLERRMLGIFDSILVKLKNQDSALSTAVKGFKEAITVSAAEV